MRREKKQNMSEKTILVISQLIGLAVSAKKEGSNFSSLGEKMKNQLVQHREGKK